MKTPSLLVILCLLLACPLAASTTPTPADAPKLAPTEVETLLAPIALYPDALIGIILPASTNSTDIVLAARYAKEGGAVEQADSQPWDESVRALAHYPDVLKWMDENLEWTQQLGVTFLVQSEDVMAAIQTLRTRALALGNLPSTGQLTVLKEDSYIRIVPTVTETIYVPRYDPDVIYVSRYYWSFGPAWGCGPWLMYDCNWRTRTIWFGAWHPRYFRRPAWVRADRRPPPHGVMDRHTWRPNPHRRPGHRLPPPRPGHIVRPRPIGDSHFANKPGEPTRNRPSQRPGNNFTDSRRPSGKKGPPPTVKPGDQQHPSPPKGRPPTNWQTPPGTSKRPPPRMNNGGTRPQPPPATANRLAPRPPRNPNARAQTPAQRQSPDVSKSRSQPPPSQPAQSGEPARRVAPPAPPPASSPEQTSSRESSASRSSSNTTTNLSGNSGGRGNRGSGANSRSSYQPSQQRRSSPPPQQRSSPRPAPRGSR